MYLEFGLGSLVQVVGSLLQDLVLGSSGILDLSWDLSFGDFSRFYSLVYLLKA